MHVVYHFSPCLGIMPLADFQSSASHQIRNSLSRRLINGRERVDLCRVNIPEWLEKLINGVSRAFKMGTRSPY